MKGDNLTTGVDSLLEFLKSKNDKVALSDAAKELGLSENTIKLWTDFLIEEKVIGIEYKFTKPYIYLNKPSEQKKSQVIEEQRITLDIFKKDFIQRATSSNIPKEQIEMLWNDHVINQLALEKQFFYQEARKRMLENVDDLWTLYKKKVLTQQNGT